MLPLFQCVPRLLRRITIMLPENAVFQSSSTRSSHSKFSSRLESLRASSQDNVLMKIKPYTPPPDIEGRIVNLMCRMLNINAKCAKSYVFQDNAEKFKILAACVTEFNHLILNSFLHEITDISSLVTYFSTPVESPDALYRLTNSVDGGADNPDLPPNLHIQHEPLRYHPNKETFFKTTAYPGRSTIVSDLAALKKHKGFRAVQTRRIRVESEDKV